MSEGRTNAQAAANSAAGTGMALFAMGLGVLVIANDFTALNVALPAIEQDFDVDVGTVQWTINAYALTFGMVLVTGWPARRHVRPPADLLHRHRDLRRLLAARRVRPERRAADRDAGRDGRRRRLDVAGDPRHDLRRRPRLAGRVRRRADPRRRRARQRDRAAARRRAHRRAQLARDLLPQHPGRDLRRRGDRGQDPPAGRPTPSASGSTTAASSPSRSASSRCCWRSTSRPTGAGATRGCWR